MAREIEKIIIHCSATPPSMDIGRTEIDQWHRARGWLMIGYHWVIRRDGTVEQGRTPDQVGAHARGHNHNSIGICLVGGLSSGAMPAYNFTHLQMTRLAELISQTLTAHSQAEVIGHNEVSDKACPSFDVRSWWALQVYMSGGDAPRCPKCHQRLPA